MTRDEAVRELDAMYTPQNNRACEPEQIVQQYVAERAPEIWTAYQRAIARRAGARRLQLSSL